MRSKVLETNQHQVGQCINQVEQQMGDRPISGGIDRQMVGQTNQPTDRLTQTDRDIQTDSLTDRQTIG